MRFYTSENCVLSDYVIPDQFQGYPGVAHGGIVAAMLDEAAARSQMVNMDENSLDKTRFMVTAKLEIRYRQHVPVGKPLQLVGKPGKIKGHTAVSKAFLYDDSGTLLAEADALLMDVPKTEEENERINELDWKVYPKDK